MATKGFMDRDDWTNNLAQELFPFWNADNKEQQRHLDDVETRRRIWMTCMLVDVFGSMISGGLSASIDEVCV